MHSQDKNSNPEFKTAISYNNERKKLEIDFKYAMHYSPRIKSLDVLKRRQTSLLLVIKGEYKYSSKDISFTATDGDMIFLPCNSTYTYKIMSEETESMQVEFNIFASQTSRLVSLCKHPILIKDCIFLREIFESILSAQNTVSYEESFGLMKNIYTLLSHTAKHFDKADTENNYGKITPAVNYITNNFNNKIYVSELAQMCGLSESQLRRLFSESLKMSPIEYKNKLRVNYAISMLNDGYVNISEIAENLGFDNVYAFSQFFKKETGVSPSNFFTAYK